MKRILSLLFAVMLLTAAACPTAFAAKTSGKCGKNAKWSYDAKKKTLTISGKGAMAFGQYAEYQDLIGSTPVTVIIKKGITQIDRGSFGYMHVKKLTLPSTLKTIKENSLRAETEYMGTRQGTLPSTITIPKSVTKIEELNFYGYGFKTIEVEKGNKNYVAVKGVLFNKKKTTLLQCPQEKTGKYTIPDSVKRIGAGAFHYSKLTRLVIPEGVKEVGYVALDYAPFKELVFLSEKVPEGVVIDAICHAENIFYRERYESNWLPMKSYSYENGFKGEWWGIYTGQWA